MRFRFCTVVTVVMMTMALTGGVSADVTSEFDKRLDQKVTYQAKGERLCVVLDELSKKTQVPMRCGTNARDWQVRDRKVSIFVKDYPLRDLQKSLAALMHFTWSVNDRDGVITYRLVQTAKARAEQEALRVSQREREAKEFADKVNTALDEIYAVDTLTPEEIAKLRTENPWQYVMAKEPAFKVLGALLKNIPEAKSALLSGSTLKISLQDLPADKKEVASAFIEAVVALQNKFASMPHSGPVGADEQAIIIRGKRPQESDYYAPEGFLGEIMCQSTFASIPVMDSKSQMAKVGGKMLAELIDNPGISPDSLEEQFGEEMHLAEAAGKNVQVQHELDEEDPDLQKVVKLEDIQPDLFPDILEALSKKVDLQIISDHFTFQDGYLDETEGKLVDLLKAIAAAGDKRARKSGSLLTFEDPQWFEKRAWEVAEDQLARWKKAAKAYELTLNDLADMAALSDEQIDITLVNDDDLCECAFISLEESNRDLLRLYGTLNEWQTSALAKGELSIAMLNSEQKAKLRDMMIHRNYMDEGLAAELLDRPLLFGVEEEDMMYVFAMIDPSKTVPVVEPSYDTDMPSDDTEWSEEFVEEASNVVGSWYIPLPAPAEECDCEACRGGSSEEYSEEYPSDEAP